MVFLVNLARIVFAPLVQPVADDFGIAAASLGIVTSAAWLGSAAPRLPTGYLLTRVRRHRVILFTGSLLVGTSIFTAFAESIVVLIIGAFLMGVSSGMYFIAANPLVSELFPDRVGTAIGVHGVSSQIAAAGAPLAVSVILLFGEWRITFLLIGVIATVATTATWWAARRTTLPAAGSADRSLRSAGRAQWRTIITGIAFIGAAGFLWNGLFNLYGDYLEVAKGIDADTGRTLLSAMFAAGLPAFLITGRLADRVRNIPLLLAIVATFVAGVFLLTFAEGFVPILILSLIIGYAIHALFPAVDTYMLASLPDRHRASAYALFSATMMGIQAFGSGTVGIAVASGASYDLTFRALAVAIGLIVISLATLYYVDRLPSGGTPGQTPDSSPSD